MSFGFAVYCAAQISILRSYKYDKPVFESGILLLF